MKNVLSKAAFVFLLAAGTAIAAGAQSVTVTSSGGTPSAQYNTISDAFASVNAGTHQGTISIAITGNLIEPSTPSALLASGQGGANYTSIVIRPTVTAVVKGAPAPGNAVIMMDGADKVTIDGSITPGGTTRDLTIQDTALVTIANTAAIRLIGRNSGGLGTDSITIRNANIIGNTPGNNGTGSSTVTTSYGIYAGGSVATTMSNTAVGFDYDRLTIENNLVKSAYVGIYVAGSPDPGTNDDLVIRNNEIGSSVIAEQVTLRGIDFGQSRNALITGNHIHDMKTTLATTIGGIEASGADMFNSTISHNRIHSIYSESSTTSAAAGIIATSGTLFNIVNNVIYDIRTSNYSSTSFTYPATGIRIVAGVGYNIFYNSIHLFGNYSTGGTVLARSVGISLASVNIINVEIRNNIFSNTMTTSTAANGEFLAMWFATGYNFFNANIDNNAYMIPNDATHFIAKVGTTAGAGLYSNLTSWRAVSQLFNATNDVNSVPMNNGVAPFTSDTDLRIPAGTGTVIESGGAVIPSLGLPNVDHLYVNRPAFGGSAPDIGAYEFDGSSFQTDLGAAQLIRPVSTGCHSAADSVVVRIQNYASNPIDFATDPLTVTASVTGPNPMSFPPVVVNTGTLMPGASINVLISSTYNMSSAGTYVFSAISGVTADLNAINDTLPAVSVTVSHGTAALTASAICQGGSSQLQFTGANSGITLQWQSSADGITWSDIAGAVNLTHTVTPTDTTYYRAVSCGTIISNVDTVVVLSTTAPVTTDATRCGPGTAVLTATGSGNILWYDAPSGGNLVGSGASFTTPVLTSTQSFYAVTSTGGGSFNVGMPTISNTTSGAGQNTFGIYFDALAPFTLNSVTIYPINANPGTPGTVDIVVIDDSGTIYHSTTVNVVGYPSASPVAQVVPLNFNIAPGTNYRIVPMNRTGITGLLFEHSPCAACAYPYVAPGALSINYSSLATGTPRPDLYYYFYDWSISTGCQSTSTPATVTVTPSDTIIAAAVTNPICDNASTVINVSSANANYTVDWSPSAGLDDTTGLSALANPTATTTYIIHAIDSATGCEALTNYTLNVSRAPQINATPADTLLCFGSLLQVFANASVSDSIYTAGTGLSTTTAASTTTTGPYGGTLGGIKHQYLVRAAELTAAGLTAGPIGAVGFDVANLNSSDSLAGYTIRMGLSSLSVLTSTFETAGMTTVYSATDYVPVIGWNMHPLSAFTWDGTSSIIVEVCFNNNNAGYTNGNASVRYTAQTGHMIYSGADNTPGVCNNLTGTVSANRPNIRFSRTAPATYQWNPAASFSNPTIGNPVINAVATGDYIVMVSDNFNNCMNTDTVHVNATPPPPLNLGPDTIICSTSPGFFLDATGNGLSYMWQDNTTAPTFLVTEAGTYYVSVTDVNNCMAADTVQITEIPATQVTITTNIVGNSSATLDAGPGFTSYIWSTLQTSQAISVTQNGTYSVTVTDTNGCTSSIQTTVVFSLGINEDGSEASLQYFPNPSNGIFDMKVEGFKASDLQMEIMDMHGRVIYSSQLQNLAENFTHRVDLSGAADGTYLVRVTSANGISTSRIVISK